MAQARKRRPGEREEEGDEREDEEGKENPTPIDVETIAALREADPNTRKFSLLRIQKLHGNATVQRLMRELEGTDASRDARMQQIGNRAFEPVPSGTREKAVVYRAMMEAEVESAANSDKSEGEIVQDTINTVGQIFANYQNAMHMFEAAIGSTPTSESVPREAVQDFLAMYTQKFFAEVMETGLDAVPFLAESVDQAIGFAEEPAEDIRQEKGEGQPTNSLKNLALAERERLAYQHERMLKSQRMMIRAAVAEMTTTDPLRRDDQRDLLTGISVDVNRLEMTTHSAEWLFRSILAAWKEESKDTSVVQVDLDEQWTVKRAHIRGRDGKKLARQLIADNGGTFDLNELKLARRVVFRPAELAEVEVELGPDGAIRAIKRNEKGGPYVEEITRRLRSEGLPATRILSGD
jgi:hypothetical protein